MNPPNSAVYDRPRRWPSPSQILIVLFIPLMLLQLVGITAAGIKKFHTFEGAAMLMAGALALVWNVLGGTVCFLVRKPVRELIHKSPLSQSLTFVLFATGLALLEEALTTTLTNLAPLFGHPHAFITASTNYFEVVLWHSVIVIAPMFLVWGWLLTRYAFSPSAVTLLFGANGILAELLLGGFTAVVMAPFWIFVYGLMIFLPAYSFPISPQTPKPRWYYYFLAVLCCLLVSGMAALIVQVLSPHLPHFGNTFEIPKS